MIGPSNVVVLMLPFEDCFHFNMGKASRNLEISDADAEVVQRELDASQISSIVVASFY